MSSRLPRKATNDYRICGAFLAAFIASGAVAGTVLLTRAPGMSLRPKSAIARALDLVSLVSGGREKKNDRRLAADSTEQTRASKTILEDATSTGTGNGSESNPGIITNHASGVRRLGWSEIGTSSLSAASTYSGAITPSSGSLLLSSASTGGGGAGARGSSGSSLAALAVDGDISWTGLTSTAWGTSTNWSPTGVPTGADNAVFNSTFSNQPSLGTTNRTIGGIWMTNGVGQNVTISGSATLTINGNTIPQIGGTPGLGILVDNTSSFTLTISAPLKLGNNQTWTNVSGNLLTISGPVDLNKQSLTIDGSGNTTITGAISSSGSPSLVKNGSGTLTLTGANTYAGTTTVNGGILLVNNTSGSANGSSAITVNNGGTLAGTGTVNGTVIVNAGGTISPGIAVNSPGILSMGPAGALTLQPGSNFLVDINGLTAGTGYDQLRLKNFPTISGSNLVITVGTTLNVGDKFFILLNGTGQSIVGQFAQGTSTTQSGYTFSIDYFANGDKGAKGNDILLTVTGVPEPSTWIGGALAVAALAFMQRRHLARCAKRLRWCRGGCPQLQISGLRVRTRAATLLAVAFFLLFAMGNAKAADLKEARVTQIVQDVRLLESNASPRPASVNDSVRQGTAVRTGTESRAELTFTDQTLTRLGANTVFNFGAEARTVDLSSGAVLIYVPKNAGGAKIRAGAATAAVTGTTVTVEYDPRPPGAIKYTVLEGSMCIRLNGQAVPIFAGQQLIFSPNATSLPEPASVDLKRLLETSQLTAGSTRPLPSAGLIAGEARHQREVQALIDNLVRAVGLAGVASAKDASTSTFINAYSSVVIRAKNEELCMYAIAAVTLRPDLIGEILVATRKSRKGEPRFTCECLERIIRAAIAADSKAAGTIVQAALYAEPDARDCIGGAAHAADPCQQGTNNLVVPSQTDTINPSNLQSEETVSPEQ